MVANLPAEDGFVQSPEAVQWAADEYWVKRRLSPNHLLVHDVLLAEASAENSSHAAMLEMEERLSSTFIGALKERDNLADSFRPELMSHNRQEQAQLKSMAREYGWINTLRLKHDSIDASSTHCRWIHISSKFSEYLQGTLLALTDTNNDPRRTIYAMRELENCIHTNERFSKHGRYFTPYYHSLSADPDATSPYPFLLSLPFLDWSLDGPTPPLRFQVDPREGYQSGRGSAHLLRSLLQYFYKLEDTSDRERKQVFARHKPWATDRELDLKVRRWYGHYPQSLKVDELWVLAVDDKHIVTFSSNQSWKSRWPPLQLASRVADVSFRSIRNALLLSERSRQYDSKVHAVACISGAVGIMHRSFWADIPLCLTDRYAGYLSHLQYRLYRAPSTKLVMDLMQVQEELNIVMQITQQQLNLLNDVQRELYQDHQQPREDASIVSTTASVAPSFIHMNNPAHFLPFAGHATFRQPSASMLSDPMSQLLENLGRELSDLKDLRDNSNNLVNRTIGLVNIRLEDHGKAILVFTIVTIIFLPLSFVSSFFGMNVSDIRNMQTTQWVFWAVALALTVCVVGFAMFMAFYGGHIYEYLVNWRDERERLRRNMQEANATLKPLPPNLRTFKVLDASRSEKLVPFG